MNNRNTIPLITRAITVGVVRAPDCAIYEGPTVTNEKPFSTVWSLGYDAIRLQSAKKETRLLTFSLRVFATFLPIRLQTQSNSESRFGIERF